VCWCVNAAERVHNAHDSRRTEYQEVYIYKVVLQYKCTYTGEIVIMCAAAVYILIGKVRFNVCTIDTFGASVYSNSALMIHTVMYINVACAQLEQGSEKW